MNLTNLTPNTTYTTIVESRSEKHYREINNQSKEEKTKNFVMRFSSKALKFTTPSYPENSLDNLRVLSSTCDAIMITWDSLPQNVRVLGYRVDVYPAEVVRSNQIDKVENILTIDLPHKNNQVNIKNLDESTEYFVVVTSITKEYFESIVKETGKIDRVLPANKPAPKSKWLPRSSLLCCTSGTNSPHDLKVDSCTFTSLTLSWQPPKVKGTNHVKSTLVKWVKYEKHTNREIGKEGVMQATSNSAVICDLDPGEIYRFKVEAVIGKKLKNLPNSIQNAKSDYINDELVELKKELSNWKEEKNCSAPLLARTRVPCESPRVLVTGFTTKTCNISWQKPQLLAIVPDENNEEDENDMASVENDKKSENEDEDTRNESQDSNAEDETNINKRTRSMSQEGIRRATAQSYIKLHLLGYRLDVNNKPHMRISPSTHKCTLIHCNPGHHYVISLRAITCPLNAHLRKKANFSKTHSSVEGSTEACFEEWKWLAGDEDSDLSHEKPINVHIPHNVHDFLSSCSIRFIPLDNFKHDMKNNGLQREKSLENKKKSNKIGHAKLKWEIQKNKITAIKHLKISVKYKKIRNKKSEESDDETDNVETFSCEADENNFILPVFEGRCVLEAAVSPQLMTPNEIEEKRNNFVKNKKTKNSKSSSNENEKDENDQNITKNEDRASSVHNDTEQNGNPLKLSHQAVQVLTPGAPSRPILWLKEVRERSFCVEWCEPLLFGGSLRGYQLILDGRKEGDVIGPRHKKATISYKKNRIHRVNLIAISNESYISDSCLSYPLFINPVKQLKILNKKFGYELEQKKQKEIFESSDIESAFELKASKVTSTSIALEWNSSDNDDFTYKIFWKPLVPKSKIKSVSLPKNDQMCVLHNCIPGAKHLMRLFAFDSDSRVVLRSTTLKVATLSCLLPPTLAVRAVNFNYMTIEWNEPPNTKAENTVLNYRLYLNGSSHCDLPSDTFLYTLTGGVWCREYIFQIQALSREKSLSSGLSDPLVVVSPGLKMPVLTRVDKKEESKSPVIQWEPIILCGGAELKQCKFVVTEEASDHIVESIEIESAKVRQVHISAKLSPGTKYSCYLQAQLHGTPKTIKSQKLIIKSEENVKTPQIEVKVVNLNERKNLEIEAAKLTNKRDRLLQTINFQQTYKGAHQELEAVEAALETCLKLIEQEYTGHLTVEINWKSNGFASQLLVDGKVFGKIIKAGQNKTVEKLPARPSNYSISMTSVGLKNSSMRVVPCEAIQVDSSAFLPYSYFCFFGQHPKAHNNTHKQTSYLTTFAIEKKFTFRNPIHQGMLKDSSSIGPCQSHDLLAGSPKPLPIKEPGKQLYMFWSPWLMCSVKYLRWLRQVSHPHQTHTVCCEQHTTTKQSLINILNKFSWTSSSSSSSSSHFVTYVDNDPNDNIAEIFGVVGVPTFILLEQGRVAWRGRYNAVDFEDFSKFISHVFNNNNDNLWQKTINFAEPS